MGQIYVEISFNRLNVTNKFNFLTYVTLPQSLVYRLEHLAFQERFTCWIGDMYVGRNKSLEKIWQNNLKVFNIVYNFSQKDFLVTKKIKVTPKLVWKATDKSLSAIKWPKKPPWRKHLPKPSLRVSLMCQPSQFLSSSCLNHGMSHHSLATLDGCNLLWHYQVVKAQWLVWLK